MIEFGAGGKVARREETTTATPDAETAEGATASDAAAATPASAPTPTPPTRERRKKKAKGWFCPVCRQRESRSLSTPALSDNGTK
jgi:hypothetical protein